MKHDKSCIARVLSVNGNGTISGAFSSISTHTVCMYGCFLQTPLHEVGNKVSAAVGFVGSFNLLGYLVEQLEHAVELVVEGED